MSLIMRYIPKSKIQVKTTSGGELEYSHNRKAYMGYYIETSDGRFFEGRKHNNFGKELSPIKSIYDTGGRFNNFSKDTTKFNIINNNTKEFLEKTKSVPTTKTRPTLEDNTRGNYSRYFMKRVNSSKYLEISKDTFNSINTKDGNYDHNLYETGNIIWYVRGNVHKLNSIALKKVGERFPKIITLFPILNEFQYIDTSVPLQENLYTEGGELYFSDGGTYIGDYHIHPTIGPMAGATHSEEDHNKLYYTNQLPSFSDYNQTYETFLQQYSKIKFAK